MPMPRRRPLLVTDLPQPDRRNFFKRVLAFMAGGALVGGVKRSWAATSSADPFLGEIAMVGFNFAPRGWALCDGQLLAISQNTALFSLLGTIYGGDGRTTFALPDLRGRFPLHAGTGPGLSPHDLGERAGVERVTLNSNQMPNHTHGLMGQSTNGTSDGPGGMLMARNPAGVPDYGNDTGNMAAMHANAIANVGGSQPHENMPPYLAIYFIIALQGIYPSRN